MKCLVVLCLVAIAAADVKDEASAPILRSDYEISPEGAYKYVYETANGIIAEQGGELVNTNSEYPSLQVRGAFRYTSPENEKIELSYTADENGYQPSGSHLPVPPPIPPQILRSLEYLAAHPPQQV